MRDKSPLSIAFGSVLKELREKRSLTQEKLAELASLNERSHVSSLERGERAPLLVTLFALGDALGLPASKIIELVEQKLQGSLKDRSSGIINK